MLKHNVKFWLLRATALGLAGAASSSALTKPGLAQNVIIPDATLEGEASQVVPFAPLPSIDLILGGAIRGPNLFHSFEQFDIGDNSRAYFITPNADIGSIFARVTGGNPSQILGVLGIRQGNLSISGADLFLINPNGIIFGQNSALDVGGSFTATTANAVQFGAVGSFSTIDADTPSSLLSINPSAYFFSGSTQGDISSRSARVDLIDASTRGLRVPDGEAINFLGGNVLLDSNGFSSGLHTRGGQIQIGSVDGSGIVGVDANGSLNFSDILSRANILLTNGARLDVRTSESGGSISIVAGNIRLENDGLLIAGIRTGGGSQNSQAGNILLDALGNIEIIQSEITNSISIGSVGRGGNIQISGNSLLVKDSPLQAFSLGQGDVGDILIEVGELASFDSAGIFTQNGVPIDLDSLAVGNSGEIKIRSGSLLLANGSTLSTSTFGIGNAGTIQVDVDQEILLNNGSAIFSDSGALGFNRGVVGEGGNIKISSSQLRLTNSSGLQTATFAQGNAGNITLDIREFVSFENNSLALSNVEATGIGQGGNISIRSDNVTVTNGSQLATGTRGQGDAGSILINAERDVSFSGAGRFLTGGAFSTVESTGFGNGGNITISANNLLVENEAQLAAGTRGIGNAGSILIKVIDTVSFDDGAVFSTVEDRQARGNGGNISIVADTFVAENGSQLVAATNGIGNAGNIILETSASTTFDGVSSDGDRPSSAITAVLTQGNGNGGTIRINSDYLFLTDGGRLLTETRNRGDAGNVEINANSITINGVNENSGRRSGIFSGTTARSVGQGGIIFISASTLEVSDGGSISARTDNLRDGGEIIVNASYVNLNNQASVEALSTSLGNAGNIFLNLRNQLTAIDSEISTTSTFSAGGQININANGIVLIGDSDIQTFVESSASGGGDITITGNFIIALNDSDILAFASRGTGGNITLQTPGFFGENFTLDSLTADPEGLDGNGRVDINATGIVSGVVTIPNISVIENSLTNLQDTIVDTATLTAGSCIARTGEEQGRFVVTGSGGLPMQPGGSRVSVYPTGSVQSLSSSEPQAVWQSGDPIVEPTDVFSLPDGRLVLSRACDDN